MQQLVSGGQSPIGYDDIPNSERRTGNIEVLVPAGMHPNDRNAYIRHQVRTELAKIGEWPVQIECKSGHAVSDSPGLMRWGVTYDLKAFVTEI